MNAHVTNLNQLWEIDASPADVLTTDGRHALYLVIDIWSRRVMILVTKTPRTEATLSLIRRAILEWGVPATIKTDNGSDFTSRRFVSAMNAIAIKRIENDAIRGLDLLLAPVAGNDGWRQASKRGVQIDQAFFISPYLMPGTRYYCRHDPQDMGQIYCFESEAGTFAATAVCPERAGIDPHAAVKAAREKQTELIAESTKEFRAQARSIKPRDMVGCMMADARQRSANVVAFPQTAAAYSSAALSAASDAMGSGDSQLAAPKGNVVTLPETRKQRVTRAVRLEAVLTHGDPLPPQDMLWLGSYQTTAEYRSQKDMLRQFGADAVLDKS